MLVMYHASVPSAGEIDRKIPGAHLVSIKPKKNQVSTENKIG